MRKALRIKTEKILKEHRFNRRWGKTLTALSLVVALGMSHALILPAVTLEDKTYCGYEQHVEHAEECYTEDKTLTCELSEEGHKHDDNCYEEQTHLTCVLEENDGHMHSEGCLDESGEQICGLGDGEGAHHHSESCYTTESMLICKLDETEPHVHSEDCYSEEKELTCTLELHEHTLQCYSNPGADVESSSIWERTFEDIELSGNWDEDVIAIAESQIGYTESEKNYIVAEDGTSKKGYTRYGDWYGDPYGDWCAMFCSFCLYYAGVDRDMMPIEAGCGRWIRDLEELELYHGAADTYEAKPGDLIFFDYDEDGDVDHVGLIFEIKENEIKTIEGNKSNRVRYDSYSAGDPCILGYGELPENPNQMMRTLKSAPELMRGPVSANGFTVSADPEKTTYLAGEEITFTVNYQNVTGQNLNNWNIFPYASPESAATVLEGEPTATLARLNNNATYGSSFTYTVRFEEDITEPTDITVGFQIKSKQGKNWVDVDGANVELQIHAAPLEGVMVLSGEDFGSDGDTKELQVRWNLKNYSNETAEFDYTLTVVNNKNGVPEVIDPSAYTVEWSVDSFGEATGELGGSYDDWVMSTITFNDPSLYSYNFEVTLSVDSVYETEQSVPLRLGAAPEDIIPAVILESCGGLEGLYYGNVARDGRCPFSDAESLREVMAEMSYGDALNLWDIYKYDLYDPNSFKASDGVGSNNAKGKEQNNVFDYGDERLVWPKDAGSPFHEAVGGSVNPLNSELGEDGVVYSEYFKAEDMEKTAGPDLGEENVDRTYTIELSASTNPERVIPRFYVLMIQTSYEMFDLEHANNCGPAGQTYALANLYDIKKALIRFAEYLKWHDDGNVMIAVTNFQHKATHSMIGGYFSNDMNGVIGGLYGWDSFGDCEHIHYGTGAFSSAMDAIPGIMNVWTDATGNLVGDLPVTSAIVIGGAMERGDTATIAVNSSVDHYYAIQTNEGAGQVCWLDTSANRNIVDEYYVATTEDAVYNALIDIYSREPDFETPFIEEVTITDTVTKDFVVHTVDDPNNESAVRVYIEDTEGNKRLLTNDPSDPEDCYDVSITPNSDGTTKVDVTIEKIVGEKKIYVEIDVQARDEYLGSNNAYTNVDGSPKIESYKHTNSSTGEVKTYDNDGEGFAFEQRPQVNVPLQFEVDDGLTEETSPGTDVNIADLAFQDEDKQDRITEDVEDMVSKGYQVNGTLSYQWYDEDGNAVGEPTSVTVRDGQMEGEIDIPSYTYTTKSSDVGKTISYTLIATFAPDAVDGNNINQIPVITKSDVGTVHIRVEPEEPDDPIIIPELVDPEEPPKWTPELEPDLKKQIDYLGDNDGVTGMEDMYRLYLNLQGDSEGIDLVLVLDNSNSMYKYNMGDISRAEVLKNFLNGSGDDPGFVTNFLGANPNNQLSVVTFGTKATILQPWTQEPVRIDLAQEANEWGSTNYVSGLHLADELLHDGAVAESGNQKLVIFLGDGEVTSGYYDGQLHNDVSGTFIYEGSTQRSLWQHFNDIFYGILDGTLPDPNDLYLAANGAGGTQERVYSYEYGTKPETASTVRFLRDLCLEPDWLPGYENGAITDEEAFYAFWDEFYALPESDAVNLIYSLSNAEIPTRTCDLHTMTKHAFVEFMHNNPDVCVHTVGFSNEINVPKTDILGNVKTGADVLKYMAKFGRAGEDEGYHFANNAQTLASEINSICFMTNTEMTDTLSAYVQAADDHQLKVVQKAVDGSSEVVLYENGARTAAGERILETASLDPATGRITVKFLPTYPVSPEHIYSASFNVQLTPEAYTRYVTDGCTYPDVGDPETDYPGNHTSTGQPGYYSNAEGKVTWTAGEPDEKEFPHPVVQVPESRLYELPHTGGRGTLLYTLGGIALMASALMIGFSSRRRRERRMKT